MLMSRLKSGALKQLKIVLKSDSGGSLEALKAAVAQGRIDTVVAAIVDMQGRLVGKRFQAEYFLDSAIDETHGCNYLLADDIDISRGDLIVTSRSVPPVTQDIDGTIAWLAERPLAAGAKVLIKHGTKTVQAMVKAISGKLDLDDARLLPAESLALNDIGHVNLRLAAPIPAEEYLHSRSTGAFLLIDAQDGTTLAAGMVGDALLDTKAAVEAVAEATVLA